MFVPVVLESVQGLRVNYFSWQHVFQLVADLMVKNVFPQFEVGLLRYHILVICPCVKIILFEHVFCSFWVIMVVTYFEHFDHCFSPSAVFK